jgi:hypothetical protein
MDKYFIYIHHNVQFKPNLCNSVLERMRFKLYQMQKQLERSEICNPNIAFAIKLCSDSCYEIFKIQHILRILLRNKMKENICVECFNNQIQKHLSILISYTEKLSEILK